MNNFNSKRAIILASAVLAAGAGGIWFYTWQRKRRALENQSEEGRLNTLRLKLEKNNGKDLSWLQNSLDSLFYFYTVDSQTGISALSAIGAVETEQNGHCTKHLKSGAFYYECYDCSIVRRSMAEYGTSVEENCIYQSICEDCFDMAKHRGHHFKRYEASAEEVFRCSCGDDCLTVRQSFCDKHQGYEGLRKDYEKSQKGFPNEWKQLEDYFMNIFYLIFTSTEKVLLTETGGRIIRNSASTPELYSDSMKEDFKNSQDFQKKSIEQYDQANALLSLTLDKMKELIDFNESGVFLLVKILSSTLPKPIRIHLEKIPLDEDSWKSHSLFVFDHPVVNTSLTILDLILAYSRVISLENDEKLSQILNKCSKADKTFRKFFTQKFFERIFLLVKKADFEYVESITNAIKVAQIPKMPTLSVAVMEHVSIYEVFIHLIDTLKEDFFKPFDLFDKYLSSEGNTMTMNDQVIYLLFNICFEPFKQLSMLHIVLKNYSQQLIAQISRLGIKLFELASVTFPIIQEKQVDSRDNQRNVEKIEGDAMKFLLISISLEKYEFLLRISSLTYLDQQISLCFINLADTLIALDNQQLTKDAIDHLITAFTSVVDISYSQIKLAEKNQKVQISFSASAISCLPQLIALSERQQFSKEVVNNFFDKHFPGPKKQEVIQKLSVILQAFGPADKRTGLWASMRFAKGNLQATTKQRQLLIQSINSIESFLFSSQIRIYDGHILATQLLLLVMDNHQRGKFLNPVKVEFPVQYLNEAYFPQFEGPNKQEQLALFQRAAKQDYITIMNELNNRTYQILYDSTPMLNLFSTNTKRFFAVKPYEQHFFEGNIQETLISTMQIRSKQQLTPKTTGFFVKALLHHTCELQFGNSLCTPGQPSENDLITLIDSHKYKIFPRHYLRYFEMSRGILDYIKGDKEGQITRNLGSDLYLINIFPHQAELLLLTLLNVEYQEQMIKEVAQQSSGPHLTCFFATPIHLTLVLLQVFKRIQKEKRDKLKISSEGSAKKENEQIVGKTIVLDLEKVEDVDMKLTSEEQKQTNTKDIEERKQEIFEEFTESTGFDEQMKDLDEDQIQSAEKILKLYQKKETLAILQERIDDEVINKKKDMTGEFEKNLLNIVQKRLEMLQKY